MHLHLRALLAALVLAVVVAACGGGAGGAQTAAATGAPRPTVATPAASTAAPGTAPAATLAAAEPTASTGATSRDALPVLEFVRADGVAVPLPVEVPPPGEYGIGLSGRRTLDERGMLFHYNDPRSRVAFWMKDTHVDLSIAFVDAGFRVVEIREMHAESLEIVRPGQDYQYAVEAPAGWYAAHGIAAGDGMRLRFTLAPGSGG